jgi:hypothetical protein
MAGSPMSGGTLEPLDILTVFGQEQILDIYRLVRA